MNPSDPTPPSFPGYVLDDRGFYRPAGGHVMGGWVLTCPDCGLKGTTGFFDISPADECWCPACKAAWTFEPEEDRDEK